MMDRNEILCVRRKIIMIATSVSSSSLTYNQLWWNNLYRATDADAGSNAVLRYSLIGGNTQGHFVIDSLSGDVAVVQPLDYEAVRTYRLVIRAQGKNRSIFEYDWHFWQPHVNIFWERRININEE